MAGKAEVQFDPSRVMPHQVANNITELGFPSEVIENETGDGTLELEVWYSSKYFLSNFMQPLTPESLVKKAT